MDNQQLDQAFLRNIFSNDEVVDLIKKYASLLLIVIFVESVVQIVVASVPLSVFFSEYYQVEFGIYLQIAAYVVSLIANLIVAITVKRDMRGTANTSWVLFGLTLLFKEIGVLFFLLLYIFQNSRRIP